jgi:hypothetical protein
MATQPQVQVEPRILRIFISYASEDSAVAKAIATGFNDSLPAGHTDVCFDKWFLEAGTQFKVQIEQKLEKTDVFVMIYTGVDKLFTEWELGFFEAVKRNNEAENKNGSKRRIVPLFLEGPPATASEYEGRSLKISRDLLKLSIEDFSAKNVILKEDPMCVLIEELQEEVEKIKEEGHYPKTLPHERRDPVECVKNMRLAIFGYLKTTVRQITKPQKEITIKTTGAALRSTESGLPPDAWLVPIAGSPMSIFGLADTEMSWETFLQLTAGPHQDAWREAISGVVTSSQAERVDVDNTQMILSNDESKIYRIVLTTATKRWNDSAEFNLYFVEAYKEPEYGDQNTTLTLKGLEVACRYRFMFLEDRSQFSANNILATDIAQLPEMAAKLLRELDLMNVKANRAGLNDRPFWSQFQGWSLILELGDLFRQKEQFIRELIGQILNAKGATDQLKDLRQKLSTAICDLEDGTRKQNGALIEAMAKTLQDLVKA